MRKTVFMTAFLMLGVAFNSYADDSARIEQLEKDVQGLQIRIAELEQLISSSIAAKEVVTTSDSWKSIANWRRLTTAMGYEDVQKLLGEPERVEGGNISFWYYKNGGSVTFMRGKLSTWSEPRQ